MTPIETPMASYPLGVETRSDAHSDPHSDPRSPPVIAAQARVDAGPQPLTFDSVYHSYAPFVWRNARRLGVSHGAVEDVMQEVFLVVYRRLPDFEERTPLTPLTPLTPRTAAMPTPRGGGPRGTILRPRRRPPGAGRGATRGPRARATAPPDPGRAPSARRVSVPKTTS
jgi:hypothetical protein